MISVCIPVYNQYVSKLCKALLQQANQHHILIEIVLIDDDSDEPYNAENAKLQSKQTNYIQLPQNVGRAKIRNLFLEEAKYNYLLFLDCDSELINDAFLINYQDTIKNKQPTVVFGGSIYINQQPPKKYRLRWLNGTKVETKSAKKRQENPYKSFKTNNFLIEKQCLANHRFDERLTLYGHEDTLFGYQLKQANIPILHINNPVLNANLDTNQAYMAKVKESTINLVRILSFSALKEDITKDVALVRVYNRIKPVSYLVSAIGNLIHPMLIWLVTRIYPNLLILNFIKLVYFCNSVSKNDPKSG